MKSWLRSTALAVVSAITLTGAPAIANAAPTDTPDTAPIAKQATQEQLEHAVHTLEGVTTNEDGDGITLKNGTFKVTKEGDNLEIVDGQGKSVISVPLKGIFGDSIYTLRASLSSNAKTVTLTKGQFEAKATKVQLAKKNRFTSNTKAWFKLYRDYADYALQHDTLNFVGGTALGVITGIVGGFITYLALDLGTYPLRLVLALTIIGIPVNYLLEFTFVFTGVTVVIISTLNMPAVLSSKLAKDPVAHKKANRLLRGTKAYFTGGDVAHVR